MVRFHVPDFLLATVFPCHLSLQIAGLQMRLSSVPNLIRFRPDTQIGRLKKGQNHWTLLMFLLLRLPSFVSSAKVLVRRYGPLGGAERSIVP